MRNFVALSNVYVEKNSYLKKTINEDVMVDIIRAEQLALETWYMATIMKHLTATIAEECCLNETYMIDLLAKHLLNAASNAHYEFIKE